VGSSFWLPQPITDLAKSVDSLFYIITWVAVVIFLLVEILLVTFVIRYRRKHPKQEGPAIHGNHRLEIIWTAIPALILVVIAVISFPLVNKIQTPPKDSMEIQVTGRMWSWEFRYPNGVTTYNELRLPVGKDLLFRITSSDVIHSFWLPEWRIKQDAVPGRETQIWARIDKPGTYEVKCAEYCGTNHSQMLAKVITMNDSEFDAWMNEQKKKAESQGVNGQQLVQTLGCLSCHSTDGSQSVGPTWKGLFGSKVTLQDGSTVTADEAYLKESIVQPGAKVVQGYSNIMTPAQLNDQQVKAILDYLKSLN
jgi:cytochrome c oxidase subunit 2